MKKIILLLMLLPLSLITSGQADARAHVMSNMNADFTKLPQGKKNSVFVSGMMDKESSDILNELTNELINTP
jgi:hypothetical protein